MFWRNLIVTSLCLITSLLSANAQIVRSAYTKTPNQPAYNTYLYYGLENRLILSPEYDKKNIGIKTNKGTLNPPDKSYNWNEKIFMYNADGTGMVTFYVFDSIKNTILDSCSHKIRPLPNPRIKIFLRRRKLGNPDEIAGGIMAIIDTPQLYAPVRVVSSELKCKDVYIRIVSKFNDDVLSFLKNIKNGDTVYCKNAIVKVANDTILRRIRLNEIICYKINGILYYTKWGVTADRLPSDMDW